jgi:GGDEF domain-containing protein
MVFDLFSVIYGVFIVVSSLLLGKSVHHALLIVCASLFICSCYFEKRLSWLRIFQVVLLAVFHRLSQLNWCEALYLILSVRYLFETRRLVPSLGLTVFLMGVYECVRFTYSDANLYALLGTGADLGGSILLVVTLCYALQLPKQQPLGAENRGLSVVDALTGLVNYESFHRRLDQMASEGRPFVAFLVDCTNLKAMNHEHGFQKGNEILKEISRCLTLSFPDALVISRYSGDKFAIALHGSDAEQAISRFSEFVEGPLTEILEMRCPYSYAIFPYERQSKHDIVSVLEERLFEEKRLAWRAQEAQLFRNEKLKVLGEIAASMAHEIRNPLTTVKGFLQVSQRNAYNVKPWFDLMMGEIDRVTALTEEFLTFSKPHVARFEIKRLQECVAKVCALVEPEMIFLRHHFTIEQDDTDLVVRVDVEKLAQVLLNLLKNSFEAMTTPGVVSIRTYAEGDEGIIEIRDTGPGIPADSLQKVFHPFYTTKETGTGLGLYICQQIIHEHGGSIAVSNPSSGGACFRISLPLLPSDQTNLGLGNKVVSK